MPWIPLGNAEQEAEQQKSDLVVTLHAPIDEERLDTKDAMRDATEAAKLQLLGWLKGLEGEFSVLEVGKLIPIFGIRSKQKERLDDILTGRIPRPSFMNTVARRFHIPPPEIIEID